MTTASLGKADLAPPGPCEFISQAMCKWVLRCTYSFVFFTCRANQKSTLFRWLASVFGIHLHLGSLKGGFNSLLAVFL